MGRVPQFIITSLMTLGLLESEAKVYAALVLYKNAEVKDMIEFLDISKPSIYESLRTLRERGIAVVTNTRPAMYQAIPPEIAIKMLMRTYTKAAREALEHLGEFEREGVVIKPEEALWSIYGTASIDLKLEDMVAGATQRVFCMASERYMGILEKTAGKGLDITLLIISDGDAAEREARQLFSGDRASIRTVTTEQFIQIYSSRNMPATSADGPDYKAAIASFDFSNMLVAVVDDAEFLYIPPLPGRNNNALYTTNRTLILATWAMFGGLAGIV